ncbi:hypothetical protein MASR1M65_18520 [Saprospiraceae bacterium]
MIEHMLFFPYTLKFHARKLFDYLMSQHTRSVLNIIGEPIDVVWSFDLSNIYRFRSFKDVRLKIFHPVDEPLDKHAIQAAKGSDVIFSVTREILEKYDGFRIPKFFINHGIIDEFIQGKGNEPSKKDDKTRVGLSGNFTRSDIDYPTIFQIVEENPEVIFEFFGAYTSSQSNIGGGNNKDIACFVDDLLKKRNTVFHGPVKAAILPQEYRRMDAFLICYDIKKDQSKGTNYYKIMEFISTGKVIVSNNVTTYNGKPELLMMPESRENNKELPALFSEVINQLEFYNSTELKEKRISFALDNTYTRQIERIECDRRVGVIIAKQRFI